jgi:hypothetical protein
LHHGNTRGVGVVWLAQVHQIAFVNLDGNLLPAAHITEPDNLADFGPDQRGEATAVQNDRVLRAIERGRLPGSAQCCH